MPARNFSCSRAPDKGYFNLEMNCGGTFLLGYAEMQPDGEKKSERVPWRRALEEIYHSMPEKVNPEIAEPTEWRVKYFVPFAVARNLSVRWEMSLGRRGAATFISARRTTRIRAGVRGHRLGRNWTSTSRTNLARFRSKGKFFGGSFEIRHVFFNTSYCAATDASAA